MLWTLVIALALQSALQRRPSAAAPPPTTSGFPARIAEALAFALDLRPMGPSAFPRLARTLTQPWDRAVGAVLAAEGKDVETARTLALDGPEPPGPGAAFRDLFRAAYLDGPLPAEDPRPVLRALGSRYAAQLLEARLQERRGQAGSAGALRDSARKAMGTRFAGFAILGFTVVALFLAGSAFGIFLIVTRKVPPRLELRPTSIPGRDLAWFFALWSLALLFSGTVAGLLLRLAPGLAPLSLPLAYGFHAVLGLVLLGALEGQGLRATLARLGSPAPLRALGWAAGFLALAVALVVLVALVMAPLLKTSQPPQKELMDLIRGSRGALSTVLLFATMAVLAPCFEELVFRGTLLPWLQSRLGPAWAIPVSALAFATIHLQPLALPTLFTLGAVLGLAARRTGSLLAPIAVHAVWNGGVFLVMKLLV
jgi:membrane protease YdiL (CAAX protease family)